MKQGYYSLVLHAHLPYVRHREAERLEERWLFEAISETYIPLLWNLEQQEAKKMVTISFSPPLMEMLADPLMQRRYLHSLKHLETLLELEKSHVTSEEEMKLVYFYKNRLTKIKDTFMIWEQNILNGFKHFQEQGKVVCITSSATHAFLPYLQTEQGLRAQIRHGITTFKKHFDTHPRGFWLPECAFTPGVDRILFEEGIRYTFVDEHAIEAADPTPSKGDGTPTYSPHGVALFPRNSEISSKVWSSYTGYPGDYDYREFYRDVAYEREWEYIKPFMHSEGFRFDTGLKYRRVTGSIEEKAFYNREWALEKVEQHSKHFIESVSKELEDKSEKCYPPHIIMTPFDAELFGHWWFEGPDWISKVIELGSEKINFITPEEFLDRHYQDLDTAHISFNTWGRKGFGEVWLNEKNCWIYRHLHRIEKQLIPLVTEKIGFSNEIDRTLKQLVREWMLAVSSDWPFIIDGDSATEYANNRINEHINRFEELKKLLAFEEIDIELLTKYEAEYPFLNEIDLNVFISKHDQYVIENKLIVETAEQSSKILMLAWEFPPMMVGGLSRHVYDLSKALVNQGNEVHVITTAVHGYPSYEINYGVHVHRITSLQPHADSFYDWVGSLNIAFTDYVRELAKGIEFHLIHAHDWLVSVAAKALKHELSLPLIATIHATEKGRNNGLFTQLQKDIHHKEWELMYEARKVIVCSEYMKKEVVEGFQLPEEKIEIIPNGVDLEMVEKKSEAKWKQYYGSDSDIYIFSVGRMVREKGFQTIIAAAPEVLKRHPNVKFIIAGKGPMLDELRQKVQDNALAHAIHFVGFVEDDFRNQLLNGCDICLFPSHYEPFGIVALEGLIAGKPTIVSDVGGFSEIVTHDETGLKMFPDDAWSLVVQVCRCIEDKQLANKISINGKLLAENKYSWEAISQKTIGIYNDQTIKTNVIGGYQ